MFPLTQLPEMARGKGVRLQRYKDGGISDAKVVHARRGPDLEGYVRPHLDGSARPTCKDWIGNRAEAGRLPPKGFPKNNRFG